MKKMRKFRFLLVASIALALVMTASSAMLACNKGGGGGEEEPPATSASVTLNKTALDLEVDDTYTLIATTENTDESVVWSSSDNSVASVSGGLVTALKAGSATITAQAGGASATCLVSVMEQSSLAFLVKEMKVRVGGAAKKLSVLFNGTVVTSGVQFRSNDENIATVDANGYLSGVGVGQTSITATYGEYSASMNVTVENFIELKLDTSRALIKSGGTATVTAKVLEGVEMKEADASNVEWTIKDDSVASLSASGGTVTLTGLKSGVTTLSAFYDGSTASAVVSVAYSVTSFESLQELAAVENAYLVLQNDIDLSGVKASDWNNAGKTTASGYVFSVIPNLDAVLDGNGHGIYGLALTESMNQTSKKEDLRASNVGFIGEIGVSGSVYNLWFDGSLGAIDNVGDVLPIVGIHIGLFAWKNNGTIADCYIRGSIISRPFTNYYGNELYSVGMVYINNGTVESVISDLYWIHATGSSNFKPRVDMRRYAFAVSNQGYVKNCVAVNEQYQYNGSLAIYNANTWTTSTILTVDSSQAEGKYTFGAEKSETREVSGDGATKFPNNYPDRKQQGDPNRTNCYVFNTYDDLFSGTGLGAVCVDVDEDADYVSDISALIAQSALGDAWTFDTANKAIKLKNTVVKSPLAFSVEEMHVRIGDEPTPLTVLLNGDELTSGVQFESNDTSIATVDANGLLSGVAAGQTSVTATYGEFSASIKVTVGYIIEIELDTARALLKIGESATVEATVLVGKDKTPGDASSVQWTIEDDSVASLSAVSGSTVTVEGVESGITTLTAQYGTESVSVVVSVAYSVADFARLKELAPVENAYIVLADNIDLGGVAASDWNNAGGTSTTGRVFSVIANLNAVIDGNGKKIFGLTLTESLSHKSGDVSVGYAVNNVGFIGEIGVSGSVYNLLFDGSLGATEDGTDGSNVKPIVGIHIGLFAWKNNGTISDCYIRGSIISKPPANSDESRLTVGMVYINNGTIERVISDIYFKRVTSSSNSNPTEELRRYAFAVSNQGYVGNCVAVNEQYTTKSKAPGSRGRTVYTWTTSAFLTVSRAEAEELGAFTFGEELKAGTSNSTEIWVPKKDDTTDGYAYADRWQQGDPNRENCYEFLAFTNLLNGTGRYTECRDVKADMSSSPQSIQASVAQGVLGGAWSFDGGQITLKGTVIYSTQA